MTSKYPKGSIWRRWDLHIHAPGTAMEDRFGSDSLEAYLNALEQADEPAAVLAVTDYCSIRTYKKVLQERSKGRLSKVELVLPNIEFRMTPETRRNKGVNLHIIVSPEDSEHIQRIEEALGQLAFPHHDDIYCSYEGLVRLGRGHDPKQTDEWGQYRTGVAQFKPGFDALKKWYEGQTWLRKNSLVGVSTGEDGLGGLNHDGGLAAVRDQIKRFTHFLFSSKNSDRSYWLGEGGDSVETLREKYKGPKPCLSGSDAHSLQSITEPTERRYCWIKADPTFEGLRQVLYEPRDRVWIGPTPPTRHDDDEVIRSLNISNSRGWFEDASIALNPGLVAVIGSRGSGKTALSDLIAYAAGAQVDPQDSFLARAQERLHKTGLDLRWVSGRTDRAEILGTEPTQDLPGVKYLSQKFVEHLCSGDRRATQLRNEIENVVFGAIAEDQRLGCDSFRDLVETRTAAIRHEAASIDGEVQDFNRRIAKIDERISRKKELEAAAKRKVAQIAEKRKQLPEVKQEKDKAAVENLNKLNEHQQALQRRLSDATQKVQRLNDLSAKAGRFRQTMEQFWADFLEEASDAGVAIDGLEKSKPNFPVDPVPVLARFVQAAQKEIGLIRGASEQPTSKGSPEHKAETIASIGDKIQKVQKQLQLDEQKRKRLLALNKEILGLERGLKATQEELRSIKEDLPQKRNGYAHSRSSRYLKYFSLLDEEKAVLEQLYAHLQERLSRSGENEERRLELYIKREVDLDSWVSRGDRLFDRRKVFKGDDDLRDLAHSHLLTPWQSGDGLASAEGVGKIIETLQRQVGKKKSEMLDVLNSGNDLTDVADWLFSVDHIELQYDIRYDGTELEKLSPGTKGIVLLVLFLALETDDSRPLLIDQPEENLDNQSIYDLLIGYFRAARARRQVILITHNPNLVVNTDADQVIIAHCERRQDGLPHIVYRSGALEAADMDQRLGGSVRGAIVNILEGGEEAFRMRERKLGFRSV